MLSKLLSPTDTGPHLRRPRSARQRRPDLRRRARRAAPGRGRPHSPSRKPSALDPRALPEPRTPHRPRDVRGAGPCVARVASPGRASTPAARFLARDGDRIVPLGGELSRARRHDAAGRPPPGPGAACRRRTAATVDAPSRASLDLRRASGLRPTGSDGRPFIDYWVCGLARTSASPRYSTPARSRGPPTSASPGSPTSRTRRAPGHRQAASLDHAIWLHRRVEPGSWLLYELTSPVYRESLALSTGRFFDLDGRLVASVAQESLLREHADEVRTSTSAPRA